VSPDTEQTPGKNAEFVASFRAYLRGEGLKSTRQRDLIASEFVRTRGHVSVDDLLHSVREKDSGLGYATVYRTLKLLVEAGMAGSRNFGEGFARFEPLTGDHHDHLICESCGRIVEFHDELLEARQETVVAGLGCRITHHRHELFGICGACIESGVDPEDTKIAMPHPGIAIADLPAVFRRHLSLQQLRVTRQRMLIAEVFATVTDHVSVDDMLERVKREDTSVGYATVYRTLKLLVDAGLAGARQFGDGFTRFEPRVEAHHDHFVDEERGLVLEFHDEEIELRQEEIAREHGFRLTRHRHDLFGVPLVNGKEPS